MQLTQQELDVLCDAHARWWQKQPSGRRLELTGSCVRHLHATGKVLVEATFSDLDASDANLSASGFDRSAIRMTSFARSRLLRASFSDCTLEDVDFSGAMMDVADLSTGLNRAKRLNLRGASMVGGIICKSTIADSVFDGINLEGANLLKMEMENCSLRAANLRDTNIVKACFTNVDLRGADLTGARFLRAHFKNVRVNGVCGPISSEDANNIYGDAIDISTDSVGHFDQPIESLRQLLLAPGG